MNYSTNKGSDTEKPHDDERTQIQSEPEDPNDGGPSGRRSTRLAGESLEPTHNSAKPLWECGCDECRDWLDPISDTNLKLYAVDECPQPQTMTVARAKEAYVRYQTSSYESSKRTSLYERAKATYGSIMEADRLLQRRYDELTTAMITRRQSPLYDQRNWIRPVTLHSRLANTFAQIRDALNYRLSQKHGLNWEYIALTAHTESCATPHQHIALYVDDPDNIVNDAMLRPVVSKHVSDVPTAYDKDHGEGAVTVQHDPETVDHVPQMVSTVLENSEAIEDTDGWGREVPAPTTMCQYVANQHPHLCLGHLVEAESTIRDEPQLNALLEGGAIAWASPHQSVTSSAGIALS